MWRLLISAALLAASMCGCGRSVPADAQAAQPEPAAQQPPATTADQLAAADGPGERTPAAPVSTAQPRQDRGRSDRDVKTPIVRALLDALGEADDGGQEGRDLAEKMLRDSDDSLHGILGTNSREAILRANRRLAAPRIETRTLRLSSKSDKEGSDKDTAGRDAEEKPSDSKQAD